MKRTIRSGCFTKSVTPRAIEAVSKQQIITHMTRQNQFGQRTRQNELRSTRPNLALSPAKLALLASMLKKNGLIQTPSVGPVGIRKCNHSSIVPLSLNQECLWFIDQLSEGQASYTIPGALRLQGRLDVNSLRQSLSEIVNRHEILRTNLVMENGKAFQVIVDARPTELQVIDLQNLEPDRRETEALRLAQVDARQPIELRSGPLLRTTLVRLSESDHVLLVNFHHIIADGWSLGIFHNELSTLYAAFVRGEKSPLPDLNIQYADFAIWQRQHLVGDQIQSSLEFWRGQFEDDLPTTNLPNERPRSDQPSFRGGHESVRISGELSAALRELAHREHVTLYVLLMSAFAILLNRWLRQSDLVVGSTYANRNQRELEPLIGFFATTLPFRIRLNGNPDVSEVVQQVAQTAMDVSSHQHLPLANIVKELQPTRDLSRNPIYQIVFDVLTPDHNPAVYGYGLMAGTNERRQWANLELTPFDVDSCEARFDLAVFLWDLPDAICGTFEYRADLFDAQNISQLVTQFVLVLQEIVNDPNQTVDALVQMLIEAERKIEAQQHRAFHDSARHRLKKMAGRTTSNSG